MADTPTAKNGLSSRVIHAQRRKYVHRAYPLLEEKNGIDMWYGSKPFYGRIDHRSEAQLISETNLKNFASAEDLMAADFVVDAFEDFRQYIIKANRMGKVNVTSSFIGFLIPKRAWVSAREEFDTHIREVYRAFVSVYLEEGNRHNKIREFGDFMKQFLGFIKISSQKVPFTLSGLITSRFISPMISGLALEFSNSNYDDDAAKFKKFMSDPNFLFYQRAARKFGFRVDYNMPWRLVADISSAEMKKYMSKYEITSVPELFDVYYYSTYRLDIALIKPYLVQLYNDYVTGNPFSKVANAGPSSDPQVKSFLIERKPVNEMDLDAKYDNFYWLKFYFLVRSSELKIKWSRAAENKKLRETKNVLELVDFPAALDYINEELFKNS